MYVFLTPKQTSCWVT